MGIKKNITSLTVQTPALRIQCMKTYGTPSRRCKGSHRCFGFTSVTKTTQGTAELPAAECTKRRSQKVKYAHTLTGKKISVLLTFFLIFSEIPAATVPDLNIQSWNASWQKGVSGVFGYIRNPAGGSGLLIHFHGSHSVPLELALKKELFLAGVQHEFLLEVSGPSASGRFLIEVADINGRVHRLNAGQIRNQDFSDLRVPIPFAVKTRPEHPKLPHGLTFRKVIFVPDSESVSRSVFTIQRITVKSEEAYRMPEFSDYQ